MIWTRPPSCSLPFSGGECAAAHIAAGIGREINLAGKGPGGGKDCRQPENDAPWRGANIVQFRRGLVIHRLACHWWEDVHKLRSACYLKIHVDVTTVTDKAFRENTRMAVVDI